MQLLRTTGSARTKYSLAFVSYGDESSGAVVELTYNPYGVESLLTSEPVRAPSHRRSNAAAAAEAMRAAGGNVTREAGPVKGSNTVIAFVQDPDGYKIELIESTR